MARIGKVHYVSSPPVAMSGWPLGSLWAGADVSIVSPSRVRYYALSMGQLAKTDPIDAGVIGDFATAAHPKRSEKPTEEQRLLCALVDQRQQLNEMRTAETNRLETAADPSFLKLVITIVLKKLP